MSGEEDAGDKPHQATPERLRKARAKGDVLQSPDAQTAVRYAAVLLVVAGAGAGLVHGVAESLSGFVTLPQAAATFLLGGGPAWPLFAPVAGALFALAGCALGAVLCAVAAMRAVVFVPSKLKPDLKRVSPYHNAKQKFGPKGLGEFVRTALKAIAFCVIGTAVGVAAVPRLLALAGTPAAGLSEALHGLTVTLLSAAVAVSLAAAAADLLIRKAQRDAKLRMSHQELKDETKESEGAPERKQAQRQRARDLASGGVAAVRDADVVVVNPEHFAVALAWDRAAGEVPRCVAKGTDHLALAIRAEARRRGVPVRRDVSCARALYAAVPVGAPIRPEHFAAVAAAIRFADEVVQKGRGR